MQAEPQAAELQAVTVTGPCSAAELGSTLPFEHVVAWSMQSSHRPPSDVEEAALRDAPITLQTLSAVREKPLVNLANLTGPQEDVAAAEVEAFARVGGRAIVSASVPGAGGACSASCLASLCRRTKLRVIMTVGWASARELPPPPPDDEAEDPALDSLLRSLLEGEEDGSGGAAVRAGALGVLPLTPGHARLLEVLAAAHVRSGAPLFCSLPAGGAASADAAESSGAAAVASLDALSAAGVDMRRVIVAHAQSLLGAPAALRALLATGARLCFTGAGMGWSVPGACASDHPWLSPPPDEGLAAALARLCAEGYADRLLLSLGVSSRLQLASCGGGGFGFLQRAFLPRARRHGLSAADEERITTSNAAALLCYWTPPPPPERTVRHWSCDACHRGYVEAVNEAEALPEDRVYFEKFSYRYCSTACLGAHRRAEFVQPFSAPPPPE